MNNIHNNWIGFLHGFTAVGKTSFCEYLISQNKNFVHIKNSEIKRSLKKNYVSSDSEKEGLRNKSYAKSIDLALEEVKNGYIPIIDASFHKKNRRNAIYEKAQAIKAKIFCIHLTCDFSIIEKRIKSRKSERPTWKNQASDISVYNHLVLTGDEIANSELELFDLYFKINTGSNSILHKHINVHSLLTKKLNELTVKYCKSR